MLTHFTTFCSISFLLVSIQLCWLCYHPIVTMNSAWNSVDHNVEHKLCRSLTVVKVSIHKCLQEDLEVSLFERDILFSVLETVDFLPLSPITLSEEAWRACSFCLWSWKRQMVGNIISSGTLFVSWGSLGLSRSYWGVTYSYKLRISVFPFNFTYVWFLSQPTNIIFYVYLNKSILNIEVPLNASSTSSN